MELHVHRCGGRGELLGGLRRLIRIELRGAGIEVLSEVPPDDRSARLHVLGPDCHPAAELLVLIRRGGGGRVERQSVPLPSGADREQQRVIALTVVEALRSGWRALLRPEPALARQEELEALRRAQEEERVRQREALREAEREREREREEEGARIRSLREDLAGLRAEVEDARPPPLEEWGLRASLAALLYPEVGASLLGASLGGFAPLAGPFRLGLELSFLGGSRPYPEADVDSLAFRGQLSGEVHLPLGAARFAFGLFLGAGWLRSEGRPTPGSPFAGGLREDPIGSAGLLAGLRGRVLPELSLGLRLGLGYGLGGVDNAVHLDGAEGIDQRFVLMRGPMITLQLGLRIHP